MRIAVGSDHAGFTLKEFLEEALRGYGHEVIDLGAHDEQSADYPDFAEEVAQHVAAGAAERGLLVCSTGIGMSIAANKVQGIRAALVTNEEAARLTRAHNDSNVIVLAAKYTGAEVALEWLEIFLATPFEGGRHERRVAKIIRMENGSV